MTAHFASPDLTQADWRFDFGTFIEVPENDRPFCKSCSIFGIFLNISCTIVTSGPPYPVGVIQLLQLYSSDLATKNKESPAAVDKGWQEWSGMQINIPQCSVFFQVQTYDFFNSQVQKNFRRSEPMIFFQTYDFF